MAITSEQLSQLQDALEEEISEDQDYYITADTLAYLADQGVSPEVLQPLQDALGEREGFDMLWRSEA